MQKIDPADIEKMLEEIRPDTDFSASANFAEDGLLDSFDIVTLVTMIDEKYGMDIDGRDILPENFSSAESIAALIDKTLNKAG
jgi:acyl carrier protein